MFSISDIEKIATLSSLELTQEEKETFARQFESILAYFDQIQSLSLPVDAKPEKKADHLREDVARPSGITPQDFSPYLEDGHFKVPKVIE